MVCCMSVIETSQTPYGDTRTRGLSHLRLRWDRDVGGFGTHSTTRLD
jgi:hypothetical protein